MHWCSFPSFFGWYWSTDKILDSFLNLLHGHVVYCPSWRFFTNMEMSLLKMKGLKLDLPFVLKAIEQLGLLSMLHWLWHMTLVLRVSSKGPVTYIHLLLSEWNFHYLGLSCPGLEPWPHACKQNIHTPPLHHRLSSNIILVVRNDQVIRT